MIFIKKKLNVVFLCSNISGSLYFKLNKKIKLINLKKKRFLTSIIPLIIKIRLLKPNVIFSTLLHVNLMLCFFKIFLNKDVFLVIRHGNLMVVTNNFIKKIKNFFLKFLIKKLYIYSDFIITSGKSVQLYLKKIIKKKIYFFNNPIYFKNDYNKKNFKENSWLKYNKFNYILAVGRFHEQKNYNFLINSYALLKNPKYKLAIIGDGNQKKKILNLIKEKKLVSKIKIFSFKKNILKYIYFSRFFVSTSLWEGQPNSLVQAAILGKPILCSDKAGDGPEICKNLNNSKIYKSNNFKSFKKNFYLLQNKKLEKKINFKLANQFEISLIASKYLNVINEKKK